ncbi:MAG: T9SS type A sorting domain-containing protein, partial [Flavobacteriales bacterium]|nr:T9SS type A sorting domain-containing protein [Flavobacteriales bacterium]
NLGVNGFYEYFLPEPVLVSGTYYVGWKQTSANRLNVGFDKNINNQNRIFYDLGSGWSNTGFEGSLMIRPVFVSDMDPIFAGISPIKTDFGFNVYPNPSNYQFTIDLGTERGLTYIFDLNGRVVAQFEINGSKIIDVSSWENGIYIISLQFDNGSLSREKIIIQH